LQLRALFRALWPVFRRPLRTFEAAADVRVSVTVANRTLLLHEDVARGSATRITNRVSEALRARIFAADLASIETWFDRAIEATEFESVFERN